MKIAIVTPWFSENMGYAENLLPKALTHLGHETHVITSTAQIYYNARNYRENYEPFIGPNIVPCGVKQMDGFVLHRLPLIETNNLPDISGLKEYLLKLQVDIVQTFDVNSLPTYNAAQACHEHGIKLFTGCHLHASVKKQSWKRKWKERIKRFFVEDSSKQVAFVNDTMVKCYAIAPDVAEVATRILGVTPSKIEIQSLGVDTDLFKPMTDSAAEQTRQNFRAKLGFKPEDLVCIYTGRFSTDKSPHCLARAIDHLQDKDPSFKGLFVGNGAQENIEYLSGMRGCIVHPFVTVNELQKFYWSADIGVWPKQESTSQLDAMACGLPIILSDQVKVLERVEGNGLQYSENDSMDLADKLMQLKDSVLRKEMGQLGARKIIENYSWLAIAQMRVKDYQKG